MGLIQTPIETYTLNGVDVDVKRDDLVGDGIIYPRWAKIEIGRASCRERV